jgi:hypothetical protein
MTESGVAYCAIFRVPEAGLTSFRAYEDAVLPFLVDHGGTLERRLRSADGRTEVHVISFRSAAGFASYRADPRRVAHAGLFETSGAAVELLPMVDVDPG